MTTFLKVWITHQELDLKDWTQSWKKGGHPDPKQDSSIIRGKADLSGSGNRLYQAQFLSLNTGLAFWQEQS